MIDRKICVIGLGYIGLPTAALLASKGYQVIGVDINEKAVDIINQGKIHIIEPELDKFVQLAVKSGNLKAYTQPNKADIFMICVPTPFYECMDIPTPNLEYILSATKTIATYVKDGDIIILESTSPVGTTELVQQNLRESGVNVEKVSIAYCPERVLPGKIMHELVENDRIVGGIDEFSSKVVKAFYKTFVNGEVLVTDAKTAEMSKLVENSYRDVNISFANELSMICDKLDIDVWELIKLANHHPRVDILKPGAGVGGHCIAVDPWFIVSKNPKESQIIKKAREVNNYKKEWCIEKIKNLALSFEFEHKRKPKVALMGLAFKPDIDDLRESPALEISKLLSKELDILSVEPNISACKDLTLTKCDDAIEIADIVVFLVSHKEFKNLCLKNKMVLDLCGVHS